MTIQPAEFDTQIMDIVELRHHEMVRIVMDPNSLWEVRDVDADYKGVEYNGRCSDIHTYHQLHIGHDFVLLLAHQGYHAPQMMSVNGVGRYNLMWEAGTSYPAWGTLVGGWPMPEEKEYLEMSDLVSAPTNSHEALDYYAKVAQLNAINDLRVEFNRQLHNEHIYRGLAIGPWPTSLFTDRYGSLTLFDSLEKHVPLGVTEIYIIPDKVDARSKGMIISYWDVPQMHKDIDNGVLVVNQDGLPTWSENG